MLNAKETAIDSPPADVKNTMKSVSGLMVMCGLIDSAAPADKGVMTIKPAADT